MVSELGQDVIPFGKQGTIRDYMKHLDDHITMKATQWNNVLFSDESKLHRFVVGQHVQRLPGKHFDDTYTDLTIQEAISN